MSTQSGRTSKRRRTAYRANSYYVPNSRRDGFQRRPGQKYSGTLVVPRNYVSRSLSSPMPDMYKTTLIYSDYISLSMSVVNLYATYYTFRLNSLFDPDYSGSGHQPRGFDQLSAIYDKYVVRGVQIEFVPLNCSGTNTIAKWCFVVNADTTPYNYSSVYDMEENSQRVTPVYTARNEYNALTTSPRYTYFLRLQDFYECKDIMDDNSAQAPVTGNPTRNAYGHLVMQSSNSVDTTGNFQVTFKFYCTFMKPTTLAAS